jgi:hypothetical protein
MKLEQLGEKITQPPEIETVDQLPHLGEMEQLRPFRLVTLEDGIGVWVELVSDPPLKELVPPTRINTRADKIIHLGLSAITLVFIVALSYSFIQVIKEHSQHQELPTPIRPKIVTDTRPPIEIYLDTMERLKQSNS